MKKTVYRFATVFTCLLLFLFSGCNTEKIIKQSPTTKQVSLATQVPVSSQPPASEPETETIYTTSEPAKTEIPAEVVTETVSPEPTFEAEITESLYCTLLVRCDSVLENIELLSESKRQIIPKDGIILPEQKVEYSDGESVFDILLRELRKRKIHLEFVKTPMYNSVYIEGIGNLYEFDCGDMSGWKYSVNGEKPTYGCSQYMVKNGDKILFYYTTNYLKD